MLFTYAFQNAGVLAIPIFSIFSLRITQDIEDIIENDKKSASILNAGLHKIVYIIIRQY